MPPNIDLPAVKTRNYPLLDPTTPNRGGKNARWRVVINPDEEMLEGSE